MIIGRFTSWQDFRAAVYRRLYRTAYWQMGRWMWRVRRPHQIDLELTNACNMTCPHCPRSVMQRSEGFMSERVFCKLIDEVARYRHCNLLMVGLGEPGLHPKLDTFMEYVKGKGLKVDLTTNGMVLQRFPPEKICSWPLDAIGISIDGVDGDSYHRFRPEGNYAQLCELVSALYTYKKGSGLRKPVLIVRNVIMPGTASEAIDKYRKHWLEVCDYVRFNTYQDPRGPRKPILENELRQCNSELFFHAHVRWDGRVPLCGYQSNQESKQEYLGDLNKLSLKEIWSTSGRLEEVRTAHRLRHFDEVSFCKSCFYTQCSNPASENRRRFSGGHSSAVNLANRIADGFF